MTERKIQEPVSPTLSDVTQFGRKALVVVAIGIISYLVLRMFFTAAVNYYKAVNPPPPPPPTVGFGKLPPIKFPEQDSEVWPREFVIETARNRLPEFPDRAKVFEMYVPTPSLLADSEVRKIAANYGFGNQPEMLDVNNYRWIKYEPIETIFQINLVNYNFSLLTDYQTRPELVRASSLPEKHDAVQTVKLYLKRSDLLPADIATASGEVSYIRVLAGEVLPAVSLSDANFVQVDLNRVPIDDAIEMYTPEGKQGIVSAIISGAMEKRDQIVELHYRHQGVNYQSFHTYPLKPITQAWQELQDQQGYVAMGDGLEKAVIREVVLGYFDSYTDQPGLQPIYVFSGDDGFMAYVSAISSNWIMEEVI